MKTKAGIALGLLSLFGLFAFKGKVDDLTNVAKQLKFDVEGVNSISFGLPKIFFNLRLEIVNPTEVDFFASLSSNIVLKSIRAYSVNGVFLGEAALNLTSIEIPAQGSTIINSVPGEVDLQRIINEYLNNFADTLNADYNTILKQLTYKLDIEVFGKNVTLTA